MLHQISVAVTKHDTDADIQDDVLEFRENICRIDELIFVLH